MKKSIAAAALALLTAGTVGACSHSDGQDNKPAMDQPSESVSAFLGLTTSDNGVPFQWQDPDGTVCNISQHLDTPEEVQLYSGDPIATNPSQTVGVKVTNSPDNCLTDLGAALKDYK